MTIQTLPENGTNNGIQREQPQRAIRVVEDDGEFSNLLDTARFEHMQRVAGLFANSTIIPEHYRGNIGNCFIALQMATRLRVDPYMFMQNTYVVHGRPGMEAKLAIALINSSGLYEGSLDYELSGEDPDDAFHPEFKVRAFAFPKGKSVAVKGPWVDWKLVRAEGWDSKAGSKWKTMPEMMFKYRAATQFGRLHCPERLMGMLTAEEIDAIAETQPEQPKRRASRTAELAEKMGGVVDVTARVVPDEPPVTPEPIPEPKTESVAEKKAARPGPKAEAKKSAPPVEDDPRTPQDKAQEWADNTAIHELQDWLMKLPVKVRDGAMILAQVKTIADDNDLTGIRNVAYNARLSQLGVGA